VSRPTAREPHLSLLEPDDRARQAHPGLSRIPRHCSASLTRSPRTSHAGMRRDALRAGRTRADRNPILVVLPLSKLPLRGLPGLIIPEGESDVRPPSGQYRSKEEAARVQHTEGQRSWRRRQVGGRQQGTALPCCPERASQAPLSDEPVA